MRTLLAVLVCIHLTPVVRAQITSENLNERAKAVLAQINGEIRVTGLKEPVEILRDKWGVPHIYAKNADDLFFAQGYVAAQDRMFQLDLWRRLAVGELAEVLGEDAVEADMFARLIRYRGDMASEWTSYSPDTKQIAIAFTNGINASIKQNENRLPIEFQILGYRPKPWQPEDILGRMSGIVMSRNFNDEVVRAHLIERLGLDRVRQLMPTDPSRAFAPAKGQDLKGIDASILKTYQAATKSLSFKVSKTESNNWVISGERSMSGKPMLASDPHRAIALPALRYLVHLNAPGWNVIGAGEPGLPGVALGHNERIAWGITIVGTDQADIFVEETKPGDSEMYRVDNEWKSMQVITEKFALKVKGGNARAIGTMTHRYTRHGPVISRDAKLNRAYVLKWAGSEPGGAGYLGGLAVSRAQNKAEFLKALESWKIPALNFVYTDKDGNIGWVAAGATPIRPKHDGLLPVPGNGGFEWTGYLKVNDLPQSFNPKAGWLGTANHNIIPEGYKHQIAYEFAAPYRFLRVKDNLEAKPKYSLEDFKRIQHDDVSIPGQRLARLLKQYNFLDSVEPNYRAYAKSMDRWHGSLGRDSQAAVLYAHWLPLLQDAVYGRLVPKEMVKEVAGKSGLPTLLQALENPNEAWFGPNPKHRCQQIVLNTFAAAVEKTQKDFSDPAKMRWGVLHQVTFRHMLASSRPELAKALDIGPFERSGDGNTPNNTRYDATFQQIHGATYRHLFDLADWDNGLATSAPGQSAQYGSPHYDDLAPLWARGEYFPLAYSRKKVVEVTANRLTLRPD
jgi:penicillin G amidase